MALRGPRTALRLLPDGPVRLLGYVCVKLGCEPAPLILGFILGPLMEENLRRAMLLSRGDPWVFISPRSDQHGLPHCGGGLACNHRVARLAQEARGSVRRRDLGALLRLLVQVLVAAAAASSTDATAQNWPSKPIRLVAPYARGRAYRYLGAPARRQAAGIPRAARGGGKSSGAGGNIVSTSSQGPGRRLQPRDERHCDAGDQSRALSEPPYDPLKDLRHVTLLVQVPNVLIRRQRPACEEREGTRRARA